MHRPETRDDGKLEERTINRKDGPVVVATPYGILEHDGADKANVFDSDVHSRVRDLTIESDRGNDSGPAMDWVLHVERHIGAPIHHTLWRMPPTTSDGLY